MSLFFTKPKFQFYKLSWLYLVFILVSFTAQEAKAQWDYDIAGTVKKNKKKLEGAVVTLSKGAAVVQQFSTTGSGKFSFKLDQNADYTLTVTKAGHISKKFLFSTRGVPEERAKEPFGGQDLEISIFDLPKDQKVVSQINSILSQPIAKFYYDDQVKEFTYDKGYSESMQDALANLQTLEQEANKKAEEEAKQKAAMEGAAAGKYDAAISKGDAAFGKKDYATAKTAYNEALGVKPDEAYPKGKLTEIDKLLADQSKLAEVETKYKTAISKADAALAAKTYPAAKAAYNEALAIKPAEAYPKTKIAEIDKLIADASKNEELNAKYNAAISKGDKAFAAKTYDAAKAAFNEALALKSSEKYPKDKISEIDKLLGELASKEKTEKELNDKYNAAIAKADKAMTAKTYDGAKTAYNEALGFKPAEAYPKTKLAEIDKLLGDLASKEKAEKELNDKYNAAIAKGDKAFSAKEYANAKTGFTEASGLKPAEVYPKTKLAELEKLLGDLALKEKAEKELNDKYNSALAKGDKAFAAKDYVTAKSGFTEALGIKPSEKYPKEKLSEIEKALADAAGEKDRLAKIAEQEAKYKAAIAKGDAALKTKTYDIAKDSYKEALGIKSSEQYPKDKIAEIDALIAKEMGAKALDEKYSASIAKADKSLASKEYANAKIAYNEALGFKPAEAYPKTKLAEIEKILADSSAKDAAEKERLAKEKELAEKYAAAIKKGDAALGSKEYANAKTSYNEALTYKTAEKYPKDKIAEIDAILAKEMGAKQLDEKYISAIAKGDKALTAKDYVTAKSGYTDALGLKPSEKYPKDKLSEIEKALADAAGEKDRLAKAAEQEAKYKAAITKGDAALKSKTYDAAKSAYTEALGIKSSEKYPKDKIAEIDALIAKEMGAKELNDKYNAAIVKADKSLASKEYANAKTAYNEALGFKPAEAYPKTKLAEIEKILADASSKDAAEKERLAKEKELAEKYAAAIKKGDAGLGKKEYTDAKTSYNEALTYKATEKYPKDKIAEIDAILAKEMGAKQLEEKYNSAIVKGDKALASKDYVTAKSGYTDALGLKPSEKYPKDKLSEIEKALADSAGEKDRLAKAAELEAKYKAAIAKGDAALKSKSYEAAKASYSEALGFKSSEQYPKDKIAEIEKIMADSAGEKDRLAKAAEQEAKYKAAIAKGDAALKTKTYDAAKASYTEALAIKTSEQYPKDKIAEIDALIAKEMGAKELNDKYNAAISKADKSLASKEYANAKTAYNEALGFKPAEAYPKTKLAEIEKILANASGKDAAEKDRLAKEKELTEKYNAAIAKADAAFGTKDYPDAKAAYTEALTFKALEKYPKIQIAKIDDYLSENDKSKSIKVRYDAAIAKADASLSSKDYTNALSSYKEAQGIKPGEPYPTNKITEINRTLDGFTRAKEKEKQYLEIIAKADKLFASKDYKASKNSYLDAALIKPTDPYPKGKITEIDELMKKKGGTSIATTDNKDEFRSALAQKYPEGITEELAQENNAKIIRRIVVKGNEGHLYIKKITSFGPIYCFKDDKPITEAEFEKDTDAKIQ